VTETSESTEYATGPDGMVEVPLVIENGQFAPQTVQIPADKEVRLLVDRRESNPCSDQIMLPQLGVLVDLAPNGVTSVAIPATKAGTYTLTCGMGMMSGQISVGGAAAQRSGSPVSWLILAALSAVGALYYVRRREAIAVQGRSKKIAGAGANGRKTVQPNSLPARPGALSVLGFKPQEVILICAAVGVAVIAGLALGGMFT
jgi:hypothetical protein